MFDIGAQAPAAGRTVTTSIAVSVSNASMPPPAGLTPMMLPPAGIGTTSWAPTIASGPGAWSSQCTRVSHGTSRTGVCLVEPGVLGVLDEVCVAAKGAHIFALGFRTPNVTQARVGQTERRICGARPPNEYRRILPIRIVSVVQCVE